MSDLREPIAIVGSACRFPGSASSPSKLWELLERPVDVISEFPPERLNLGRFYHHNGEHHGRTDVQNRSYLLREDIRHFDAAFFRVNPNEAAALDPQQRILLETVYESLEAAGSTLDQMDGSQTSVYVGVMSSDFHDIQMRDIQSVPTYTATGLSRSILANRISYFFNLKGPSLSLDTACSSSLVALHQAVQSLRSRESTMAIVAGTTLLLDPGFYVAESKLHMLSPDSRSRMWDKDANGYARGEGCASILLKPLSQAIADGDHIDCIIRETGVNSDGRTDGITMPGHTSQTDLICQTYRNAGLDAVTDRCQYFECHGTGTAAGDPIEARAIQAAFFPKDRPHADDQKLYCGSIKTVLGHLEGCAGLAGILKASLALENAKIPANLLFNELNPTIRPFYDHLEVPTTTREWPERAHGTPRRASVNSFGFGGTNAHVILESYDNRPSKSTEESHAQSVPSPFVFSAKTGPSLARNLQHFADYVRHNPTVPLPQLSAVLQSRRTVFPIRTAVSATSSQELLQGLEEKVAEFHKLPQAQIGTRALAVDEYETPGILFVFTGQGAQWATMGRSLIHTSHVFRQSLERCQTSLDALPDAPSWSLLGELCAEKEAARLDEAEISQPLCTALQIALVDLLVASGIHPTAVIGHSSGEIGATYAAGILNARDAIRIAYYRGLVAHLARGDHGQPGAMMAVGMSFEQAEQFCAESCFVGRLGVAASNSTNSVTLSGDADAILEAKVILDRDGIFARALKVDVAYHSRHMLNCAQLYLEHLQRCNIQVQRPKNHCWWVSSVRGDVELLKGSLSSLKAQYWVDNMVQPVLFSHALESSLWHGGPFSVALEVGPHSALKGPVGQTVTSVLGATIPYFGCLQRNKDDTNSFAAAIGAVWCLLGPVKQAGEGHVPPKMLRHLPSYSWDHDQVHWRESRVSRNFRLRPELPHELLGQRCPDDSDLEMRWRNVFHLSELPWARGHRFQRQAIFPAAGYVSMAVDASRKFVDHQPISFVEIQDMAITKALVLEEDGAGVEISFSMRRRHKADEQEVNAMIEADFACYISSPDQSIHRACEGKILIQLGQEAPLDLQMSSSESLQDLPSINVDRFYKSVSGMGIDYTGVFRALHTVSRAWGMSAASAIWDAADIDEQFALHPAILDVGFQSAFAAFSSTADDKAGVTYLPAGIRRLVINLNEQYRASSGTLGISTEAFVSSASSKLLEVDINIASLSTSRVGVQVEGLALKAIAEAKASDDRHIFAKTVWHIDVANGLPEIPEQSSTAEELNLIDSIERTALHYFQRLLHEIDPQEIPTFKWYHQILFQAIERFLKPIRDGVHPVVKQEWLNDDYEVINQLARSFPDSVDLQLMRAVGENLVSVVRGNTQMLQHMMEDQLLSRLYTEGRGFAMLNEHIARIMKHIVHKYPRASILEIGAGTGGTTSSVLDAIGEAYQSYTYTDISAGFFAKATERFSGHAHKMKFRVFNAELPPAQQGFSEGGYDIIIAANVLHATRTLETTMRHVRSLLKPGGYLVAMEVTGSMLREPFLMGALEGWWLGVDDGRFPSPGVSPKQWNEVLQATGFSGVDSIVYDMEPVRHDCSVFVAQAIDDRYDILCDPLSSIHEPFPGRAIIIGGKTLAVSKAARHAEKLAQRCFSEVIVVESLHEQFPIESTLDTSILCLTELDKPMFTNGQIDAKLLLRLQHVLASARNVLWVTAGRLSENPDSNMMIGIGRALSFEIPDLSVQFLDFDGPSAWDIRRVVESLARTSLLSSPAYADYDALWVLEPEIVLRGDTTLIPRVVSDIPANEQLNSSRRRICKSLPPSTNVRLWCDSAECNLVETEDVHALEDDSGLVRADLELSSALSLYSGPAEDSCFICMGRVSGQDGVSIFVSDHVASSMALRLEKSFALPSSRPCGSAEFAAIATNLVAECIMKILPADGRAMIIDPDEQLANAIAEAATSTGQLVSFISTRPHKEVPGWVNVNRLTSHRVLQRLLPRDASSIVTFSSRDIGTIAQNTARSCVVLPFSTRLADIDSDSLRRAFERVISQDTRIDPKMMVLSAVRQTPVAQLLRPAILEWLPSERIQGIVAPIDSKQIFRSDKTYLMVGMTGELGQSLCRYMVRSGARYIVLASRSAQADPQWLNDIAAQGAVVRVMKMDVTSKTQIDDTVALIRSTFPEIGGVANAALVLEDAMFVNTSAESFARQVAPKVQGTKFLDDIFRHTPLEFFVTFSSLGSVFGNAGQSIYHASNMFMASMVQQRRLRGLAASIIHIGLIVDIGYVAKADRAGSRIEDHLRKLFYSPLSERDFHLLFAQAVVKGHPSSSDGEIIMGIQPFVDHPDSENRPQWYSNPRFSHLIVAPGTASEVRVGVASSHNALRMLEQAKNEEEATEAIQDLLLKKIEALMNVPADSIDHELPLADLGLDSLLAVEIRAWLLKSFQVEVPLLKILGSQAISSLCSHTARKHLATRSETGPRDDEQPRNEEIVEVETEMPEPNVAADSIAPVAASYSSQSTEREEGSTSSADDSPMTPFDTSSPSTGSEDTTEEAKSGAVDLTLERSQGLSYAQAQLHFLQNYLPDPSTYNICVRYDLTGALDIARLKQALQRVLIRHEVFRTCYYVEPGTLQPRQGVLHTPRSHFKHIDTKDKDRVQQEFDHLLKRVWHLESADVFQTVVVSQSQTHHSFLFGYHHIAMDGMSWHLFLQDLNRAYGNVLQAKPPRQCGDVALDEIAAHGSGAFDQSLDFWHQELTPIPQTLPLLHLALTATRKINNNWENHTSTTEISPETAAKIARVCHSARATPSHFHLAILQLIFANLLDVHDLCVGVADAHRGDANQSSIGFFLNMLPMRFYVDKQRGFSELLANTTRKALNYSAHAHVPIDLIMERLNVPRSTAQSPLFQIAFNYRAGDMMSTPLGDGVLQFVEHVDARHTYDMAFNITQTADGACHLQLSTNSHLYTSETSQMILDIYHRVLQTVCEDSTVIVGECGLYDDAAATAATTLGVGPHRSWTWASTLVEQFDLVRQSTPDQIAIDDCTATLTYLQLDHRINAISNHLLGRGVTRGSFVAVLCEPSNDTYASMMAILRVGAIYVPLDLNLPAARHQLMVTASKSQFIIAHSRTVEAATTLASAGVQIVDISALREPSTLAGLAISSQLEPSFCLFTSGSTATPKGVLLSQAGIMNYAAAKSSRLGLHKPVVLQQSSTGFDMAVAQAFNAFANGGTLIVVPRDIRGDPGALSRLMRDKKVELTICTPSEYTMLATYGAEDLKKCSHWIHACSGGEPVTDAVIRQLNSLHNASLTFTDCYGPTETSCAVTFRNISLHDARDGDTTTRSVGHPIANVSVYVLDQQGKPVPAGFAGEICVTGCGVSLGYLDGEDNEASQRFICDPLTRAEESPRGKLYKTGDKGCLSLDGSLYCLGRMDEDSTVKLRGLRIDLQEVAVAIVAASSGALSEAVVSLRGQPAFLVAHLVASEINTVSAEDLQTIRGALQLPRYMIPSTFILVDRLPRSVNGKVDRKAVQALPLPTRSEPHANDGNLTVVEGELRLLWLEVLPEHTARSAITASSDFFEVGGSSLLLVVVQNAIKERIGVYLPLGDLYRASTLSAMAAQIHDHRSQGSTDSQIDWQKETLLPKEVSSLQRREACSLQPSQDIQVLLTGATSFIGTEILTSLLDRKDVVRIHCIAVPASAMPSLPVNDRVSAYTGSLQSANMGLTLAEIDQIKKSVNKIIHAGSVGHCLNNYSSVRIANYASTQLLASWALECMIPLHFISSNRVPLLSGSTAGPAQSMAAYPPPVDGSQGFTASKWASEVYLERFAKHTGLSVVVHRSCAAVGEEAPLEDALNSLLRYSKLMRAVPILPNAEGYIDFKPVEDIAGDIVNATMAEAGSVSFLHHSSGVKVPIADLAQHLGQLYGISFDTLPLDLWLQRAVRLGMEVLIESYMKAVAASGERLSFAYMGGNLAE